MKAVTDLVRAKREAAAFPCAEERRRLRLVSRLTQQEVADLVDVSREAVSRWELGSREPQGEKGRRYLELLRSLEELASE